MEAWSRAWWRRGRPLVSATPAPLPLTRACACLPARLRAADVVCEVRQEFRRVRDQAADASSIKYALAEGRKQLKALREMIAMQS